MNTFELSQVERIRKTAEPFIAKATRVDPVPWLYAATPSTWELYGKGRLPVYVLELDASKFSAGKVVSDRHLLHDISTAMGGARVRWKNHIGLGLVYDERPVKHINLVDALTDSRCALIVGSGGTGKTTLLQHVIAQREHNVIVCDPKVQDPGKWLDAEVIGPGGDFQAIVDKLTEIDTVMSKGGYGQRLLVIVDEFWIINQNVDVSNLVFRLVTLGREPMIDIFIGTHSERVKGLGIDGQGDLRDGFDIVRLEKGFKATVDCGDGELPAEHPGPFPGKVATKPEPVAASQKKISENDKLLIRISKLKFKGEFPVQRMAELIKAELPKKYWEPGTGAPFTYYKLQAKFAEWEKSGILVQQKGRNPDGSMKPRKLAK